MSKVFFNVAREVEWSVKHARYASGVGQVGLEPVFQIPIKPRGHDTFLKDDLQPFACFPPHTPQSINFQVSVTSNPSIFVGETRIFVKIPRKLVIFNRVARGKGSVRRGVRCKDDCWITVSLWDARHNRQQLSAL